MAPGAASPQEPDADALFLGDICFGASYGRESFEKRGFDSAFENFDELLHQSEFVIANLETVLSTQETSLLEGKKSYIHKDDPEAAAALKRHGINLVSLANNHAYDYGPPGLIETLDSLSAAEIDVIGAGMNIEDATRPYLRDFELQKSKFRLAITAGKMHVDYKYDYYADENQAGIKSLKEQSAAEQIHNLREAEPDAFIVAFPHWGSNYKWKLEFQSDLARAMVDAGADLVIGHGAHCMQEIERIDDRWVVHSIGNFVFNTGGRFRKYPDILPYSFIARLYITEQDKLQHVTLRLYPILSDNRRSKFKPRFVDRDELEKIRSELVTKSVDAGELDSVLVRARDEYGLYLELPIVTR